MDIIVNDFSIDNQFQNFEEFSDIVACTTLPLFQVLMQKNCILYKSYATYSLSFFDDVSLIKLFNHRDFKGSAEVTLLKELLVSISSEEPYWNDDINTKTDSFYHNEFCGDFYGYNPNCLSEALERNATLLSFVPNRFNSNSISISRDGEYLLIDNLINKSDFIHSLLQYGNATLVEYLISIQDNKNIIFVKDRAGSYLTDNHYFQQDLTVDDIKSIGKDFKLSLEFLESGNLSSRFTDSVTHKKVTYYEFRCSLNNNREFRVYYYLHKGKIYYLNSHIKKTQSIPDGIKNLTLKHINEYVLKSKNNLHG